MTEYNPAPSPSGHPLLSGPPTSNDIHQIFTPKRFEAAAGGRTGAFLPSCLPPSRWRACLLVCLFVRAGGRPPNQPTNLPIPTVASGPGGRWGSVVFGWRALRSPLRPHARTHARRSDPRPCVAPVACLISFALLSLSLNHEITTVATGPQLYKNIALRRSHFS